MRQEEDLKRVGVTFWKLLRAYSTARSRAFGVSLLNFLVRDADEVIRNEATLLYQPCELGYAADDVAGGAAGVWAGRREKSYAFLLSSCFHISFWTGITEFVQLHSARFARYFSILNLCIKWGSVLAYGMRHHRCP